MKKYNQVNYSVCIHPDLTNNNDINKLARDYKRHINGTVSNLGLFGRDVPFTENKNLELSLVYKVHLIEEDQYNFSIDQYNNTSDLAHMIYCKHINDPTKLCIIDFLTPSAHKQAYALSNIDRILVRAESFHEITVNKEKLA